MPHTIIRSVLISFISLTALFTLTLGQAQAQTTANPLPITPDVPAKITSMKKGAATYYTFNLASGVKNLTIKTTGTGDADIFLNKDQIRTDNTSTWRSEGPVSDELITVAAPVAGTYFLKVNSYSATSNTTITLSYTSTTGSTVVMTITKSGTGSGTVTSSPAGINCGTTCSASYATTTVVTLTQAAATGSTFSGWTGACTGSGVCSINMSVARNISAVFTANATTTPPVTVATNTLTVAKSGTGAGVVISSPSGINCGSTCTAGYASGTAVTLTASSTSGAFTGWTGACTGTGTCNVTMSAARSVTATFTAPVTPTNNTLTVTKSGTGIGNITSSPAGISCGSACSLTTASGTTVTLTATPSATSTFTGWAGACTGTGVCNVALTTNRSVVANFTLTPATSTKFAINNRVLVNSGPLNIRSSANGTLLGTQPTNALGFVTGGPVFANDMWWWNVNFDTGVDGWATETYLTATVVVPYNSVIAVLGGNNGGTVTSSPAGIDCGSVCGISVASGTTVTLTATPFASSTFIGWSAPCTGTGTCVVQANTSITVTATFQAATVPPPSPVEGLSILSFGAVANQNTNNITAIKNTIAAAKAQGVPVYVPAGTFGYSGVITLDGVRMIGAGTNSVLYALDWANESIFLRGNGSEVRNLKLTGVTAPERQAPWEATRIAAFSATNFVIDGVTIDGSAAAGIQTAQGGSNGRIINNVVRNTLSDSIHMTDGISNMIVEGNLVENSGDDGIAVVSYQEDGAVISNVIARNNRVINNKWGRNMSVVGGRDVVYENNYLEGNPHAACLYLAQEGGYATYGDNNIIIRNNTLKNCSGPDTNHAAVMLYSDGTYPNDNIILSRNDIMQTNGMGGIRIFGPNTRVTLDSNRVTTGAGQAYNISSTGVTRIDYTSGPVGSNGSAATTPITYNYSIGNNTRIPSQGYSAQSGVQNLGNDFVGAFDNGDWVAYTVTALSALNAAEVTFSTPNAGQTLEVRLGSPTGTLLGTQVMPTTGSFATTAVQTVSFTTPLTGPQQLYFVGKGTGFDLFNLRSFNFKGSNQNYLTGY